MKELEQKDKIEISVKKQKQVEYQLVDKIIPYENHCVWEINEKTLEVTLAEYASTTYQAFSENKKEIVIKKGFAYVSALNKRNALKKYIAGSNGSKKISDSPLKISF